VYTAAAVVAENANTTILQLLYCVDFLLMYTTMFTAVCTMMHTALCYAQFPCTVAGHISDGSAEVSCCACLVVIHIILPLVLYALTCFSSFKILHVKYDLREQCA
jgi:hypothetical protein